MNSILRRRRALMMAGQGGGETPVYELTNRAVSTGDSIDTEVAFLSSGYAGTVLLDITQNSNPTSSSATGRTHQYVYVANGTSYALEFGKTNRNATYLSLGFYGASGGHSDWLAGVGRHKIAITHDANSDTVTVIHSKDGSTPVKYSSTRTYSAVTSTLYIGGPDAANALVAGTIHSAKIYNRVLSQSEIDAFFA